MFSYPIKTYHRIRNQKELIMNAQREQRYRPSFTLPEITTLLKALSSLPPEEVESIITKLRLLTFRIELGVTQPAYEGVTKQSQEQKLGLDTQQASTPEERRHSAFLKWQSNPELCSYWESSLAKTYRYDNNMMTQDERSMYEEENLS